MSAQFLPFEVREVVPESEIITSFYLAPKVLSVKEFVPGEYLVFEHQPEGQESVRREYSISGKREDEIRVTIKREDPPEQGLPRGVVSNWFHEEVKAGDVVNAAGPAGAFKLDRESSRPVVLLSGGVGLTPVVAMAHELAGTERQTIFVHACENGRVHALGDEMRGLSHQHANITSHFLYREPTDEDQLGRDYDSAGMITQALLSSLIPGTDCDFYLCGPGPFMTAIYDMLHDMQVATDRIAYEFFGPATVLKPKGTAAPKSTPGSSPGPTPGDGPTISFVKSGVQVRWDQAEENLLEFAEEHGIMADFSCRAGTCDTCKTRVLSGTVNYPVEPFERPGEGYALLCCCLPDGDLELDL